MNKWIDVKVKLPNFGREVLIYYIDNHSKRRIIVGSCYRDKEDYNIFWLGNAETDYLSINNVKFWMSLPFPSYKKGNIDY